MPTNPEVFAPDDLALRVHLTNEGPRAEQGLISWEDAASVAWVVARYNAERVKILIAVYPHEIRCAWRVVGCSHEDTITPKGRVVNRASFQLVPDARLDYLVGQPDPKPGRNPVRLPRVDELPGSELLLGPGAPNKEGAAQVGPFSLIVTTDGRAEVRGPAGASVTVTLGRPGEDDAEALAS